MHSSKLKGKSPEELREMLRRKSDTLCELSESRFGTFRHGELRQHLIRSIAQIESILEKINGEKNEN